MKPSNNCLEFICKEEGEILHPYRDQAGIPTIGIGTIMYENGTRVKMTDPKITHERAIELLRWEVDKKAKAVNEALAGVPLNQNQYDACVSLAYNIGEAGFKGSTLVKKIRANPTDPSIRDWFLVWNKITDPKTKQKVVSVGLARRRKRESDLYFKKP